MKDFLKKQQEKKLKIAVVGDIAVDEYYQVSCDRISPEFPIKVLLTTSEKPHKTVPGCASNVAFQFTHCNVDCHLVSFLNHYAASVCDKHNVNYTHSWIGDYQIPIKRRFYKDNFPLSRWDIEEKNNFDYSKLTFKPTDEDVIIFSDYNKGIFHNHWFKPLMKHKITIVDPKGADIEKWRDCTIFKPNAVEAEALSGKKTWIEQAYYFKDKLNCKSVVITLGGEGVVGLSDGVPFEYKNPVVTHANSVCGAGDSFIAFLALAVGHSYSAYEAAKIAFEAGKLYVQNKHNVPIHPMQLCSKLVTTEYFKDRDYKLVFTNGCFDAGLTRGHIECLKTAKEKGDKLVVAINSDVSVRNLKGPGRPILALEDRVAIVSALSCVDYVVSFDENTPYNVIKEIMPDLIVKSGYKVEEVAGHDLVPTIIIPWIESISTTDKLKLLNLS